MINRTDAFCWQSSSKSSKQLYVNNSNINTKAYLTKCLKPDLSTKRIGRLSINIFVNA